MSDKKAADYDDSLITSKDVLETVQIDTEELAPPDRFGLMKLGFLLQGIGVLLPWNVCVTIDWYWKYKLKDSSVVGSYILYFTLINCFVQFVTCGIFSKFQNKIKLQHRVLVPLLIQTAIFTLYFILIFTSIRGMSFFVLVMFMIVTCAISVGFQQPGLFTVASFLPEVYTGMMVQGQAVGGIVVALVNIFTVVVVDNQAKISAIIFFAVALSILIACAVNFFMLSKSKLFKFWYDFHNSKIAAKGEEEETSSASWAEIRYTFKKTADLSFSIWFNFLVTLMTFPIVPMNVKALTVSDNIFFNKLWVPVYVILFFNVFDYVGRFISTKTSFPRKAIVPLTLSRIIWFILFLFCNVRCEDKSATPLPLVFKHDVFPILFIIMVGLTNGFVIDVVMKHTQTAVQGKLKPLANGIVTTALFFGLFCGCVAAFIPRAINCPKDL